MSLICTTRITTTAAAGSKTCSIQPPTSHLCMWCLFGEYTLCTTSADCTLFVTGGSLKRLCVCASVCVCVRVCMYVMDIYPKNLQVQVHRCTRKVVCVCVCVCVHACDGHLPQGFTSTDAHYSVIIHMHKYHGTY